MFFSPGVVRVKHLVGLFIPVSSIQWTELTVCLNVHQGPEPILCNEMINSVGTEMSKGHILLALNDSLAENNFN